MKPTLRVCKGILTGFMVLFLYTSATVAAKTASKEDVLSHHRRGNDIIEKDLAVLLTSPMVHQPEVFDEALRLLTSIQSSPSCTRLAASNLISSCQSFTGPLKDADRSTPDSEAAIDDLKSIYAARLAVCELVGAGTPVPSLCAPLIPSDQAKSKRGFRAFLKQESRQCHATETDCGTIRGQQLGQCLKSLESRPQWWTSYSNNRQNAVVMCHAARAQIEQDKLLDLHRSMAGLNAEMNFALANSLKDTQAQLKAQARFAEALQAFQTQLLRDLDMSNAVAQTYFQKLIETLDGAVQTVIAKIINAAKLIEADVQALSQNVRNSNNDVVDLQKNVRKGFQEVLSGSSELAFTQLEDWKVNHALATEVRSSLETIRGSEVEALLQTLGTMHQDLQLLNELVATIYLRQNSIDERLLSLDTSFEKLGDKAEALHAAQTVQAELQLHLHQSLQTGVHATNGLVDQIRTSTAYLQSAVEDTSIKVAEMASLSGFTDVFFKWSWAVLVILAASLYSGKAAGYIARCLGVVLLLELMGLSDRLLRATTALLPLSSPSIGPSPLQTSTKIIYLVISLAPAAAQPQPYSPLSQDRHVYLQAAGLVLAASVAQSKGSRAIQAIDLELNLLHTIILRAT